MEYGRAAEAFSIRRLVVGYLYKYPACGLAGSSAKGAKANGEKRKASRCFAMMLSDRVREGGGHSWKKEAVSR